MSQLRVAMTLMRGYGVRCWLYIQDLSQLKHLYPLDWETLTNNAGVVQTFGLTNHLMARQVADIFDVRPSELLAMKADEQMLLFGGGRVKRARKLDYLNDATFRGLYTPNPRYAGRQPGSGVGK
jgi:type IV secretion system protein VirD4